MLQPPGYMLSTGAESRDSPSSSNRSGGRGSEERGAFFFGLLFHRRVAVPTCRCGSGGSLPVSSCNVPSQEAGRGQVYSLQQLCCHLSLLSGGRLTGRRCGKCSDERVRGGGTVRHGGVGRWWEGWNSVAGQGHAERGVWRGPSA